MRDKNIQKIQNLLNDQKIIKTKLISNSFGINCLKVKTSSEKNFIVKLYKNKKNKFNSIKAEAKNLTFLNKKKINIFPKLINHDDAILIMEYIENNKIKPKRINKNFLKTITTIHKIQSDKYGFSFDTQIGGMQQKNKYEKNWMNFFDQLFNLPFYRSMAFTLTFTFLVTPFVIILGLLIALAVNSLHARLKGLMIFFSLLPFVITPLIGALVLFWMIDSRGILGSAVQWIFDDPDLSLKASTGLMWVSLIAYGIWHAAPFAFVIFYAGLQTLPMDQVEAAQIDGATRFQRVRYVVIPHLMPLVTFVTLIQLMDNFRVFEPIVGFSASAHAQSLSWFIFNDLGGETRQLSSASASSVLTILCVAILLSPVIIRTWQDFKGKA